MRKLAMIGACAVILLGSAAVSARAMGGGGCGPVAHGSTARHVGHGNGPGTPYCQPGVCNAR
jgi:hypothetical protein